MAKERFEITCRYFVTPATYLIQRVHDGDLAMDMAEIMNPLDEIFTAILNDSPQYAGWNSGLE